MWVRIVVSVAVLVTGIIHLEQWFVVFRDTSIIGPAMLANFAAGVVIAALVLFWHHWIPLAIAVLFGVATLGAFLVATTPIGLFGVHEQWVIWEVFVAAAAEVVAIGGGLIGLFVNRPLPARS